MAKAKEKNTGSQVQQTAAPTLVHEEWPIGRLVPYARNPRKNDAVVPRMVAAIKEFGFRVPVVVRSDGTVVDGHLRLKAAQALGMETVPVVLADDLNAEQVKAWRIMANQSANWAAWDDDLLRLELEELDAAGFDLELTGLEDETINALLSDNDSDDLEDDADLDADGITTPVSTTGDVWQCGRHRVLCGDSTDVATVRQFMGDDLADMVFTDPPYGVNVKGGKSANGKMRILGDLTQTAIPFSFDIAVTIATKEGARFYFCGGEGNIALYSKLFDRFLGQLPRHLIWVKNGFVMKPNGYHNQYEIIFYGYKQGGGSLSKWYGERTEDAASDVWRIKKDPTNSYKHPTQKPVELALRAITNSCPTRGLVYEPFGGSGSTLLACEKSGRTCRAIELDPRFVDVIVQRWQQATGKQAARESDGVTFDALKGEQ